MFLIRKTKVVLATTNPTARMMHPYRVALSDILQPIDQLPQVEGATHAPTIEHCKATVSVRSILARIFPKLGIDLKQIGSKMFAEPQKLSRGTLAGVAPHPRKAGRRACRPYLSGYTHKKN